MTQPNLTLNGIEYLLVCMQSNPGMSQRYYLRRKHLYLHSMPDPHKGGSGSGYFISPSYRDFVWTDVSSQNVFYYASHPIDGYTKMNGKQHGGTKSKSAQMHLTRYGWTRANEARKKLGLEPLPYCDGKQSDTIDNVTEAIANAMNMSGEEKVLSFLQAFVSSY